MKPFLNYLLSNTIKFNFPRLDTWCVKNQTLMSLGIFLIELELYRSKSYSVSLKRYSWVLNKRHPRLANFRIPHPHCSFGLPVYLSFQIYFYSTVPNLTMSIWETTYEKISPLNMRKTWKRAVYWGKIMILKLKGKL